MLAQRLCRFPMDSQQCELLLAFSQTESLSQLAHLMGRDISVVSRQLQKLAECQPVITKRQGRWILTSLGERVIQWTLQAQSSLSILLNEPLPLSNTPILSASEPAALLVVGGQRGFQHHSWGERNNLQAETYIQKLLTTWRLRGHPVFHISHHSRHRNSPLYKGTQGCDFLPELRPLEGEIVLEKSSHSAFSETNLLQRLRDQQIKTVVIVGFSVNHCIDATVRSAADFGLHVFLVEDAIVSYCRSTSSGDRITANQVHEVALANLGHDSCVLLRTDHILS